MVLGGDQSKQTAGVLLLGNLLQAKGRPSRIDSEFYLAKLEEGAAAIDTEEFTGLDKSLLFLVKKIHFVGADDMENTPESEQIEMYVKYSKMLTNLMDEAKHRKAPMPVRAPAQICVAAVVAAELIRQKASHDTLMILVENLLEQLEYAAAYYLDAKEAQACSTLNEMLDLLKRDLADAPDSSLAASGALVMAFTNLIHGLIGLGDLEKTLAIVEEKGADGLWYFLEQGYRFFGLPPVICRILEKRLAVEP